MAMAMAMADETEMRMSIGVRCTYLSSLLFEVLLASLVSLISSRHLEVW